MFDNLDDPRQQAMLAAAFGLLGGQGGKGFGGFARDLGNAGLLGLNRYAIANEDKRRNQASDMERQMREFQFGQQKKAAEDQAYAAQLAPQFFGPGNSPGDGMGPAMPPKADFTGYGQALMARSPQLGMPWIQAGMKDNTPLTVKEGETLLDRNTMKPVYNNPKNDLPSGMRMGPSGPEWIPGYLDAQKEIRAAGRPQVSVSQGGMVMEKEENKAKAQLNMKGFEELQNARRVAIKENSLIDAMMRNPVETGKPIPITTTGKAWLQGLGISGDRFNESVSNAQAFNAAAMEMVLNRQLAQKGPQTDSDARRLEQTVASLGNTPDANKAILAFSKAQNNRAIAQAKFYDDWWKKNKTIEGAEDAWYSSEGGKSLFETPELSKFKGATVIRYDSQGNRL